MLNPNFHIFGVRIYLRNEHTMTCPRVEPTDEDGSENGDGEDEENEEVTFRPLTPKKTVANTTTSPRAPKYTNSRSNNNIIVDDVMRERAGNNSASKTACSYILLYIVICSVIFRFRSFRRSETLMLHFSLR